MVRLEEHKRETEHKAIERLKPPPKAYIPLSQHIGKICTALVKAGDNVSAGQKIAGQEAKVFAPIHASISGKVASLQDWPHPVLGKCKAIVIENDGRQEPPPAAPRPQGEIDTLSADEIREIIFEAGIVGLGGASFPTHLKLNPPKPVDSLIVNGAECEPYLTGDYRLMVEKTQEILKGAALAGKCVGAKHVHIAIEDNKPEAIEAFRNATRDTQYEVRVLRSQYPQGGEKQLVKSVLGRQVPSGKLPFDIGALVQNVATIYAIYEAVYLGKSLYERVVTVTGSCVSNPKNVLVRIGTPIKELIDFCGPLTREPSKIIIGGPMMGIAQYTDEVPVIKSTTGIVLLDKKEALSLEEDYCIRCGACVRSCPMGLMPCLINLASEKAIWTQAKAYAALDCIECGLCNYVCPANRKLTQSIKRAKLEVSR